MPGRMSNEVKEAPFGFDNVPARPYGTTAVIRHKPPNVKFLQT